MLWQGKAYNQADLHLVGMFHQDTSYTSLQLECYLVDNCLAHNQHIEMLPYCTSGQVYNLEKKETREAVNPCLAE